MRTPRRNRGTTLLEMLIATVTLGIMGLGLFGVSSASSNALSTDAVRIDARDRANRGVDILTRRLRSSSLATLTTLPVGFQTYQAMPKNVSVDDLGFCTYEVDAASAELPLLSAAFTVCVTHAADPVNGKDDDRDGVIDDGELELTTPDAGAQVIASGVSAFSAQLIDRRLVIRLSITARGPGNKTLTEQAARTVEIRND